jgi:hypothetical protein
VRFPFPQRLRGERFEGATRRNSRPRGRQAQIIDRSETTQSSHRDGSLGSVHMTLEDAGRDRDLSADVSVVLGMHAHDYDGGEPAGDDLEPV